jgi:hypothetical protein
MELIAVCELRYVNAAYIKHGEFGQDRTQLFIERILRELHFSHIKVPYAADFKVFMNNLTVLLDYAQALGQTGCKRTVGVFRCVLDRTMSKKSAAVGTGAIALRPLVDITPARVWLLYKRLDNRARSSQILNFVHVGVISNS